ncbi:MAG: pentapeptide repeat-containing protein [Deltaproteobacteria bacterium]|nr:pentapeptide repeat-containing protein [Deltaproteobacteria bacterium]
MEANALNEKYDFTKCDSGLSPIIGGDFNRLFAIGGVVERGTWVESLFHNFNGANSVFRNLRFVDVKFVDSNLTGCRFEHCYFQNVSFENASIRLTTFENCVMDRCRFTQSVSWNGETKIQFQSCILLDSEIPIPRALHEETFNSCYTRTHNPQTEVKETAPNASQTPQTPTAPPGPTADPLTQNRFHKLEL